MSAQVSGGESSAALEAAVAAVVSNLPPGWVADGRIDPHRIAAEVLAASAIGWRPIDTAPRDSTILLGRRDGSQFLTAVGGWEVLDEEVPGAWSPEAWWGGPPTHWAPLPPAPTD